MSMVVYREFPDGEDEIGVMTFESGHYWVHVGDFDYCISIQSYLGYCSFPFTILGPL